MNLKKSSVALATLLVIGSSAFSSPTVAIEIESEAQSSMDVSNLDIAYASNVRVAETYAQSFANADANSLISLYKLDFTSTESLFADPIFGALSSIETMAMWKMLFAQKPAEYSVDSAIHYTEHNSHTNTTRVILVWDAKYKFSGTGAKIVNYGVSDLMIKDQKIIKQVDGFHANDWFRQASTTVCQKDGKAFEGPVLAGCIAKVTLGIKTNLKNTLAMVVTKIQEAQKAAQQQK